MERATPHRPRAVPDRSSAAVFTELRPLLFAIAYRMVGSAMDAEDLVQEAYLRWQNDSGTEVRSPKAYLATIVTRLAINHMHSARTQRESYVGPWLPEPLMTEHVSDASGHVELSESLSMAFLVLLERLSPVERAVFLLYEVFDFEYAEIARIVERSEANCRQICARAKKHVGAARGRFQARPEQAERLVERFTQATGTGDLNGLLAVLAEDITLWADGGGKVPGAALRPIHGVDPVARFILSFMRRFVPQTRVVRAAEINGQPGFISYVSGTPVAALVFDLRDDRIRTIYAVCNPDKLRALPEHGV
jgi:RNA polymerase sigma-70 factor (ECF subfamily)